MIYDHLIRPLLFRLDPETGHHLGLRVLGFLNRSPAARRRLWASILPADDRLAVSFLGERPGPGV